uniref:Odorant receptor n=1 Tax=Culicoides sonorensis TaxID=179676 RepID=A0A336MDW2_CULSO
MASIPDFRFKSPFNPIQIFFENITNIIGYDWLFGYTPINLRRQQIIFVIFSGILILNMTQMKNALLDASSIGHLAINVILFSAATYSCVVAVILAKYSKDFRFLIDWCGNLYTKKIDARISHIRDELFKECAAQVYLFLRATNYGYKSLIPIIFTFPLFMYLYDSTIMTPFPFHIPYLPHDYFPFYQFNYISQLGGIYFAACVTIIINSILITMLIHAKYQLDFIDGSIKVIVNEAGTTFELSEIEFMMKIVIDMHVDVLDVVKISSKIFSLQILSLNLMCYFLIGFTYIVVQIDKSSIYFTAVTCVNVLQLGFFSFLGAHLFYRLTDLSVGIYCTNWYNLSVKHQKTLQMMMIRSQKSKALSAAGFIDLSLISFLNLLSRSYSFCALVQVILFEDEHI